MGCCWSKDTPSSSKIPLLFGASNNTRHSDSLEHILRVHGRFLHQQHQRSSLSPEELEHTRALVWQIENMKLSLGEDLFSSSKRVTLEEVITSVAKGEITKPQKKKQQITDANKASSSQPTTTADNDDDDFDDDDDNVGDVDAVPGSDSDDGDRSKETKEENFGDKHGELKYFQNSENIGQAFCQADILVWSGQFNAAEEMLNAFLNHHNSTTNSKKAPTPSNSTVTVDIQSMSLTDNSMNLPLALSPAHASLLLAEIDLMRLIVSGDMTIVPGALVRVDTALTLADKLSPSSNLFARITPQQQQLKHECAAVTAHALLLRAGLEGFQGRFIKAPLTLRQSWKEFQDIPESTSSRWARSMRQFGIGMFQLFLSLAPSAAQLVFKLVGFAPNRNKGLYCLQQAVVSGNLTWATTCLIAYRLLLAAQSHRSQRESQEELVQAQNLLKLFSDNFATITQRKMFVFEWLESEVAKRSGTFDIALMRMDNVRASLTDVGKPLYRMQFTSAQLLFAQERYQEAVEYLSPMTSPDSSYTAKVFALLFLGACHGQLGQPAEAKAAWRTVVDKPTDGMGDMDKMLARKAGVLIGRDNDVIFAFELLYIMGHLKAMRKPDAIRLRDRIHSCFDSPQQQRRLEEQVSIELVCGVVHSHCGDIQTAMKHLQVVVGEAQTSRYDKEVSDKFHAPYAWYEIGIVFTSLHRWEEAVQAFHNCESCSSDYTFEKWLGYREKAARKYAEAKLKLQKQAAKK
eukprot:c8422_g1_i1.p1 GENE.c8422_g1_i1~~c8422_g1_i1.p1  ORF type:complete len:744 (-),score=178.75 c8422_g1_i1:552-2783(-)